MWFSRNQARQGKERLQVSAIVQKARYLLDEFHTANLALPRVSGVEYTWWIPLAQPWYKLNVDGATFGATQSSRVGVVIKNDAGYVLAGLSKNIPCPLGLLECEAKAMEEGVTFA